MGDCFLFATLKVWNETAIKSRIHEFPGKVQLVESPEGLIEQIAQQATRYVFFPHWSWIVPPEIVAQYECVCFHMTDVPYGRGGSPLQNLIERGHRETKISALRMTDELDAGPVYLKRPLALSERAQDIYERAADIVVDMALEIARTQPTPQPQQGQPTFFRRRTPEQSRLPADAPIDKIYDHIRMLDADTYPRAFVDYGAFRLTLSEVMRGGDSLEARVTISKKPQDAQ